MDADLDMEELEFEERAARLRPIVERRLARVYGARGDFAGWLDRILDQARAAASARPAELRRHDRQRPADWWRQGAAVGYSAYVDRFAGALQPLGDRLGYLGELGVTYLHLLPLLRSREGASDGGFAVSDYMAVEPRLGSMADLRALAGSARQAGISLVVDLVCNHTADDHAWARAARAGDERYRAYYHLVRDAEEVRRYEADLAQVFPDVAPGNFTFSPEMGAWVWTTFYPFQWDLNYANPAVFAEMLAVMLHLVNLGVDGLRVDCAPFLWKRPGTDCRNQPEAHDILAAWRALLSMVAPHAVLKAEAIERLADVTAYFGADAGDRECDLAYDNGVMTALWASLALGSAEPARALIGAAAAKPERGTWVNYVRCHDDIIWPALTPYLSAEDQAWCSRFFAGETPSSFAAGRAFQGAPGAAPSTNGMAAALAGVTDDAPDSVAARRLLLLYGVVYALDGIPVVWMGDEIALGNADGGAKERADGRWLHRPMMDWARADGRRDPDRLPGRIFHQLAAFARLRADRRAFDADHPARAVDQSDPAVLSFLRGQGAEQVQCMANFTADRRLGGLQLARPGERWTDLISGETASGAEVPLGPYQVRWLSRGS